MAVALPAEFPEEAVAALSTGRAPGAVRVTVDFPVAGLEVTVPGFFDAAVCLSLIADEVLVMLLFDAAGLDVTVLPEAEDDVILFTGRLLTVPPPRSELVPANTLSEPVLWRGPL